MKKLVIVIIAALLANTASLADDKGVVPSILNLILGDSPPYNCPTDVPTVTTITDQVWMDRNLGASRVATSKNDSAAYGDLYQWGRLTDGHQLRSSGVTDVTSLGTTPGHSMFIISNYDWITQSNDDLWQGLNGINNPCPPCFRLPTNIEWNAEINDWKNSDDAYNSNLKITVAGTRDRNGYFAGVTAYGHYWSSETAAITGAYYFSFEDSFPPAAQTHYRAYGKSVRCIQN